MRAKKDNASDRFKMRCGLAAFIPYPWEDIENDKEFNELPEEIAAVFSKKWRPLTRVFFFVLFVFGQRETGRWWTKL